MPILFAAFVAIPLVELWLLLRVGSVIGAGWTIVLVVLTGFFGASLARREGLRTLQRFMSTSKSGAMPGAAMMDAICIFAGGALLLTPGLITDAIGFALVFPVSREFFKGMLAGYLRRHIHVDHVIINAREYPSADDPKIYEQTFGPGDVKRVPEDDDFEI